MVKNSTFGAFTLRSSFEQAQPADFEYVTGSVIFCNFEW